ncbi:hypothetical protein GCM10020254_07860 [Streptomyces goshikiensis]
MDGAREPEQGGARPPHAGPGRAGSHLGRVLSRNRALIGPVRGGMPTGARGCTMVSTRGRMSLGHTATWRDELNTQVYLAYDFPLLSVLWTMLVFAIWVLWFFLLFKIIFDIFRDDSLGGWGKAGWLVFVIVLPFLGVFVYLIARGKGMGQREVDQARAQRKEFDSYVREAAAPAEQCRTARQAVRPAGARRHHGRGVPPGEGARPRGRRPGEPRHLDHRPHRRRTAALRSTPPVWGAVTGVICGLRDIRVCGWS